MTSTEVAETDIPVEVSSSVVAIDTLDTAEKRFQYLSGTFASAIVVIAEMQKNRDWETLKKADGSDYASLTDLVQEALAKSDSYARRLVQTANNFYTPLEAITVEGTVIAITASEAATLGNDGMDEVVARVSGQLGEGQSADEQADLIQSVKSDVVNGNRADADDFDDLDDDLRDAYGDDDFEDFGDDDFDEEDGEFATTSRKDSEGGSSKRDDSATADFDEGSAPEPKEKPSKASQEPTDVLGPIEKIMAGGTEYTTAETIETLPEDLQKFVQAVNYLADLNPEDLSELITEERRGAIYRIPAAVSALRFVQSATETSTWVLNKI